MEIVTQNCFGVAVVHSRRRFKRIREFVEKARPEVVCLQEVFWRRQLKWVIPGGYEAIYEAPRMMVKGGLVTLVRKDRRVTARAYVRYRSQGRWVSRQLVDRMASKGFWDVVLEDGTRVINTHLVSTYFRQRAHDKSQRGQLDQLLSYVQGLVGQVIMAGDFNFVPGSENYRLVRQGFEDVTAGMGRSSLNVNKKLDYVFVKEMTKVKKAEYIDYGGAKYPSDHKGIRGVW